MSTKEKEYRELINNIKILIINTANRGIDITLYRNTLLKIINEVDYNNLDSSISSKSYISVFVSKDYEMGIKKLRDLEKQILEATAFYKKVPQEVDECITSINNNVDRINEYIESCINETKSDDDIKRRITSILLSLSIVVTGCFVMPKVVKGINTDKYYPKNTKTYSTFDGIDQSLGYSLVSSKENDGIYLRVYGEKVKVGSQYQREVKVYDVTDISLDNLKDYISIDLSRLEYGVETINVSPNSTYYYISENDKEVEQITIDKTKKEEILDTTTYGLGIIISYLVYAATILMIEMVSLQFDASYVGILNNLINIFKKKETEEDYLDDILDLEEVEELLMLICKDEQLRNRFNELLEKNKYLLNDREELMNRINNLESVISKEEVEKLVKKRIYRA